MNRLDGLVIVLVAVALAIPGFVVGQTPPPAPTAQKTLAATMNVYVFPTKGQKPEQQSQDEAECYNYATQNTGTDPFALQKQSQEQAQQTEQAKQQAQQAGKGAGAQGAVKGAAAGAVVGSVSHGATSGEGAAAGAVVGVVAGRRKGKAAEKEATQKAEQQGQQAQAATAQQMDNFKKAFSVCLEAKNYMVKF